MAVIEVRGAHKEYRRLRRPPQRALDGLDLNVGEGGVFGFLGPNGSGKTTTIRVLLGLARPDAGEVRVLGRPIPAGLPEVIPYIGALVESPQLFPSFSGRRNLRLLAGVAGLPDSRVDEVLERVGLTDRGGDRVRGYSLGMRQRLGIAAALLKEPRLLVLDEPSNGLDPAGIREVRELLRSLGASGVTVFVSSHLLGEVEQMCDHVAIVARGRLLMTGTVREVIAANRQSTGELRVVVGEQAAAAELLRNRGFAVEEDGSHLVVRGASEAAEITRTLASEEMYVSELTPVEASLESVFFELTEGAS
ncbi:MAG TPA: ABC transporter ATP-binding protein [Mycobacteriales bacterium]|nr:ABC transporter ATP-binding protein [Mycobacteriales bacterium]